MMTAGIRAPVCQQNLLKMIDWSVTCRPDLGRGDFQDPIDGIVRPTFPDGLSGLARPSERAPCGAAWMLAAMIDVNGRFSGRGRLGRFHGPSFTG